MTCIHANFACPTFAKLSGRALAGSNKSRRSREGHSRTGPCLFRRVGPAAFDRGSLRRRVLSFGSPIRPHWACSEDCFVEHHEKALGLIRCGRMGRPASGHPPNVGRNSSEWGMPWSDRALLAPNPRRWFGIWTVLERRIRSFTPGLQALATSLTHEYRESGPCLAVARTATLAFVWAPGLAKDAGYLIGGIH
jgi:hypothetical protein